MTKDKNKRPPPPEIEILNPRYKSATPEMVARALLKNSKKKDEKGTETGALDEADDTSYSVKYSSRMITPESCCPPCRVLKKRYSGYSRQRAIIRTYIVQEVKIDENQ